MIVGLMVGTAAKLSARLVAIDSHRSRVDADLGHELSKAIAAVRLSLGIA